jgi:hypothetical protein
MEGEGLVMGEEERVGWDWEGVVREEKGGEGQARGGLHKRAKKGPMSRKCNEQKTTVGSLTISESLIVIRNL